MSLASQRMMMFKGKEEQSHLLTSSLKMKLVIEKEVNGRSACHSSSSLHSVVVTPVSTITNSGVNSPAFAISDIQHPKPCPKTANTSTSTTNPDYQDKIDSRKLECYRWKTNDYKSWLREKEGEFITKPRNEMKGQATQMQTKPVEWWLGLKEGANRDQHSRDQQARSGCLWSDDLDPKSSTLGLMNRYEPSMGYVRIRHLEIKHLAVDASANFQIPIGGGEEEDRGGSSCGSSCE
ncbi:hypothetical protein Tco_0115896 [Tanacetum coccineum]